MHNVAVVLLAAVLVVVPARPAYGTPFPGSVEPSATPFPAARGSEPPAGYRSPIASAFLPDGLVAPFDPPRSRWGAGHRGVDVRTEVGDPVRAPGAGTVSFSGSVAGRGVVVITHPDGLRSSLEPVRGTAQEGSRVEAGDVVGSVERSASGHCAPQACLHWGVRRGDAYIDPLSLVHRPVIVLLPDP